MSCLYKTPITFQVLFSCLYSGLLIPCSFLINSLVLSLLESIKLYQATFHDRYLALYAINYRVNINIIIFLVSSCSFNYATIFWNFWVKTSWGISTKIFALFECVSLFPAISSRFPIPLASHCDFLFLLSRPIITFSTLRPSIVAAFSSLLTIFLFYSWIDAITGRTRLWMIDLFSAEDGIARIK